MTVAVLHLEATIFFLLNLFSRIYLSDRSCVRFAYREKHRLLIAWSQPSEYVWLWIDEPFKNCYRYVITHVVCVGVLDCDIPFQAIGDWRLKSSLPKFSTLFRPGGGGRGGGEGLCGLGLLDPPTYKVITCLVYVGISDCDVPFAPIGSGCYFYDETLYIDSFPATVDFCATLGGYPVVVRHGDENRALIDHIYPDNREYLPWQPWVSYPDNREYLPWQPWVSTLTTVSILPWQPWVSTLTTVSIYPDNREYPTLTTVSILPWQPWVSTLTTVSIYPDNREYPTLTTVSIYPDNREYLPWQPWVSTLTTVSIYPDNREYLPWQPWVSYPDNREYLPWQPWVS